MPRAGDLGRQHDGARSSAGKYFARLGLARIANTIGGQPVGCGHGNFPGSVLSQKVRRAAGQASGRDRLTGSAARRLFHHDGRPRGSTLHRGKSVRAHANVPPGMQIMSAVSAVAGSKDGGRFFRFGSSVARHYLVHSRPLLRRIPASVNAKELVCGRQMPRPTT